MKLMSIVSLGIISVSSLSLGADVWGPKELQQAATAALASFQEKHGEALHAKISGFSIERTTQGNAAKAKVNYQDGSEKKVASFFCHVHEADEIDCH